ncbi:MAG: glycosyltransferase family A protein, partial [Verrucomicrobia bacterium]|nr:glycosyltransferase family A protein [Verrucomicrobiota bacterium]
MSERPVLVSILVPAYNAARYIPELCESIRAQTYPHYEVLIANDGSTDNTVSVLAPFLEDPRFQLMGWEQNRGLNQAWAALCSRAKGDYWCSPGADDILYPTFVERRVSTLQANPQAVLLQGPAELIDESGGPCSAPPQQPPMPARLQAPRSIEVLLQHNVVRQPATLVRMDQ